MQQEPMLDTSATNSWKPYGKPTSYLTLNAKENGTFKLKQYFHLEALEAVIKGCSVKKVFLEISQNSQENACAPF